MKWLLGISLFFALPQVLPASGFQCSQPVVFLEDDGAYVLLNVSWENSWHNERNHDAVWLFFKRIHRAGGYQHIPILADGHEVVAIHSGDDLDLKIDVPEDGVGFYVYPASPYRGKVSAALKIKVMPGVFAERGRDYRALAAYGIEMVYIPEGPFYLGSAETLAEEHNGFYHPDAEGGNGGVLQITNEQQSLRIAPDGDLYYRDENGYAGDQAGELAAEFPKGVDAYYIMKYEPTEGQYCHFLNCLDSIQRQDFEIHREENYYEQGGAIRWTEQGYVSDYPHKPCQFMGWDDAMAMADWAGLRPMTELEFTKAARGPDRPQGVDFPWGTTEKMQIQRWPDENGELHMLNGWKESQLNETSRALYGASYYWVMDLSGSLWERLVSVGHPLGRAFTGQHGDGIVDRLGGLNDPSWPQEGEGAGGFGFRGGGFYGYDRSYHDFNPFSPVAYRPYGGWPGGIRNNAYGTRFVRSK